MEVVKQTTINILKNRRSVYPRNFLSGKEIPRETIEQILELATWAPTHKLTQPWEFIVYTGNGLKEFFRKQADIYQKITSKDKINQHKLNKYKEKVEMVSHVIAVIAKHDSSNKIPEIEEIVATSCALQNIYLSLNAFGIAGYLSTGNICYTDEMAEYLQLQKGDKALGFFQLGIPKDEFKNPIRKRIPAVDKTKWFE